MSYAFFFFSTFAFIFLQAHSLIFVHLGPSLPSYLYPVITQARFFNPEMEIYLIANNIALLNSSSTISAICISCESLQRSNMHQDFIDRCVLDRSSIGGLWFYSSERFFYIDELIKERNLSDVFHLENDVLLYEDLSILLPRFQKNFSDKIAATFETDLRCVPGFLYIPNQTLSEKLVNFIAAQSTSGKADMAMLGLFRLHYPMYIDLLPIAPPEYVTNPKVLQHPLGVAASDPTQFCKYTADFKSIFDAAYLGIYLGGHDERYHGPQLEKTISPWCIFVATYCTIQWEMDSESRLVPMFVYKDKKWKINNLHLTNKSVLPKFLSKGGSQ